MILDSICIFCDVILCLMFILYSCSLYLWWYFKHLKYECFCLSPPNMKCNFAFCRNHCFVLEGEQEVKRVKCRKTSFLTLPSSIFICPPSWSSSSSWSSSESSCFRRKPPVKIHIPTEIMRCQDNIKFHRFLVMTEDKRKWWGRWMREDLFPLTVIVSSPLARPSSHP